MEISLQEEAMPAIHQHLSHQQLHGPSPSPTITEHSQANPRPHPCRSQQGSHQSPTPKEKQQRPAAGPSHHSKAHGLSFHQVLCTTSPPLPSQLAPISELMLELSTGALEVHGDKTTTVRQQSKTSEADNMASLVPFVLFLSRHTDTASQACGRHKLLSHPQLRPGSPRGRQAGWCIPAPCADLLFPGPVLVTVSLSSLTPPCACLTQGLMLWAVRMARLLTEPRNRSQYNGLSGSPCPTTSLTHRPITGPCLSVTPSCPLNTSRGGDSITTP